MAQEAEETEKAKAQVEKEKEDTSRIEGDKAEAKELGMTYGSSDWKRRQRSLEHDEQIRGNKAGHNTGTSGYVAYLKEALATRTRNRNERNAVVQRELTFTVGRS